MLARDLDRDEWIARYLAGRLSETDTARFEAYWAEHPEITRDLEASARLQAGLRDLRARGELDGVVRDRWWSRRLSLLAVAATVAAFVGGIVAWRMAEGIDRVQLAPTLAALATHASNPLEKGATYSLLRLRSSATVDATIDLPAEPRAVELRVLPETTSPDGRYVVRLAAIDDDGRVGSPTTTGPVPADPDGFVTVYVDSRELEAGRYQLGVAPSGGPAAAEWSDFRVSVRPFDGA